jgi:hypothetical protein
LTVLSINNPKIISSSFPSSDFSIDFSTNILTFNNLSMIHNYTVQLMFVFQISITSAKQYDLTALSNPVRIGPQPIIRDGTLFNVILKFYGDYATIVSANNVQSYTAIIYNLLCLKLGMTFSSGLTMSSGSVIIGATTYTANFTAIASGLTTLDNSSLPSGLSFQSFVVNDITYASKALEVVSGSSSGSSENNNLPAILGGS